MKKFILILCIFFISFELKAQTTTPAPASCTQSPCLQIGWTEASQYLPGTATIAICNGGATSCGTPSAPGTNSWSFYTVPQSVTTGSGITPTLLYGGLYQVSVNFTNSGGTSVWTAPTAFQIGNAPPPPIPSVPTAITIKQL